MKTNLLSIQNTNTVGEILLSVLLAISIISVIHMLFKLDKAADTKLYDSDALDQLKDKDSREKIDKYVEEYYKSGKWDEKLLKDLSNKINSY